MLPSKISRNIFFISLLYLFLSGLIWKGIQLWGDDSWLEINLLILKSHGIVGPLFILSFGAILEAHVRPMILNLNRRVSGFFILGLGLFAIASSLILYYSGSDSFREYISIAHIAGGAALLFLFLIHSC